MSTPKEPRKRTRAPRSNCWRCGESISNHEAVDCEWVSKECPNCERKGHATSTCKWTVTRDEAGAIVEQFRKREIPDDCWRCGESPTTHHPADCEWVTQLCPNCERKGHATSTCKWNVTRDEAGAIVESTSTTRKRRRKNNISMQ